MNLPEEFLDHINNHDNISLEWTRVVLAVVALWIAALWLASKK
tara:strand:- start:1366 stop:1494 length:129 start_codon:yes stop_codon:yes gene_type:complete